MQENTEIDINELKEENALLLNQLHQVQEDLERIFHENQRLKNNSFESNSRKLYGAAGRIRNDLPYKLGRKFIENSKSIKGWIYMPWQLCRVFLDFQKEKKDLPPVCFYADAGEAEKVKQNLSYRFGSVILNRSLLLGWITLPFSLYKTYADFKKGKVWKEPSEPISTVKWRFMHLLPGFYKLETRNAVLDFKVQEISFQLDQAKSERDQAKSERDQAKSERDQAKSERDQAKSERDQAKSERDELKKTAGNRAARIAELEAQVDDQAVRQKQIDEQIVRAEAQLEMLKSIIDPRADLNFSNFFKNLD